MRLHCPLESSLFQNSIILSVVAIVILIGLVIFNFVRKRPEIVETKIVFSNPGFKSAKTKRKEQEEVRERLKEQAE
ncbi:MAG: hypothetical protein M0P12_10380 [Paludibacteraceae bacterium]|nr:hypothetical protein [Paludibacteraceae bacterium]